MKSLVGCCAILALLLCQAVGLVHGRQLDRNAVENETACHTLPAGEDGHSGKGVHVACDSGPTAAEAVKLPTITLAVLPLAIAFLEHPARLDAPGRATPVTFAGAPPPIHLLHCRLLN